MEQEKEAQNMQSQTQVPNNKTLMGVLCYLGVLVIIPFLTSKEDPFVKFHLKQGLVVFSIEVIMWILGAMFYFLWMILSLVNLATLVLSIIGIINVVNNKEKELPVVGSFSKYFSF